MRVGCGCYAQENTTESSCDVIFLATEPATSVAAGRTSADLLAQEADRSHFVAAPMPLGTSSSATGRPEALAGLAGLQPRLS